MWAIRIPRSREPKITNKSIPRSLQTKVIEALNLKSEKPRLITSLLGKNIIKMACGGVHNILISKNLPSLAHSLYALYKNELFTDFELILQINNVNFTIKCHKYILISRSSFFYTKLSKTKEKNYIFSYNCSFVSLKTIIQYLYLDDSSFLSWLKEKPSYIDMVMDYLKLAKVLELKSLQNEIESILKINLVKYHEALSRVNQNEDNDDCCEDSNNLNTTNLNDNNGSKGLFFLPNGNAILLLNEEIINSVLKNSVLINLKSNRPGKYEINFGNKLNQVYKQNNKTMITEVDNNELFSAGNSNINNLNVNKLIHKLVSTKQLFETLSNIDENNNDIIEVLNKFNLIDNNLLNTAPLGIDLLKTFNKKDICDIQIKVGEHIFYAHRVILMCRSKFFEMMLSENFKENNMNEVEISDYNPEDFLFFLLFLYCDCLNLDLDKALELLKGADLFAVESLKLKLESFLSTKLEIENAAKIYKYASFYNFDRLKKISLAFINDNYKQVIETQEFEDLHRECMLEIIRYCKSK